MLPEELVKGAIENVPHVQFSHETEQNYYAIARLIMKWVNWLLGIIGEQGNQNLFTILYAAIIFGLALGIGIIVSWIVIGITRLLARKIETDIYTKLRQRHFFSKTTRIVTPLVFLILLQFTMTGRQSLSAWLTRISWIYIVWVVLTSISILITVIWEHVDERENKKKLPLKGLVQLIKGILWILGAIVVIGILVNKSPGSLLAGLGAFAAVLMLVFKDSILGVVAGVQLSENDSLHVGDWVKIPGSGANGTVTEVTLTSVKVLNWDKTTTSVPPYSLVSGSFTNYRSMQESNSRQIQRSYMIDADSVVPATPEMLAAYAKIPLLKDWIEKKIAQKEKGKVEDVGNSEGLVDGSIETNLGIFRAYVKLYLDAHPRIDHSGGLSFCFVTTLAQTSTGIPLQIYCFTNTSAWLEYEAIQASIFEHLAVMLYRFNLYTFEEESGRDTIMEGYLSPGKNPDDLYGLPYPFLNGSAPHNPDVSAPLVAQGAAPSDTNIPAANNPK
ncbi:MAG: mechanosensitive ion channel family protein [Muribaculaceae bacterium]|nr:mechanosensitive ion channel family protein [Muribaculaceae bacterium]